MEDELSSEERKTIEKILISCKNYFSSKFPDYKIEIKEYFRNMTFGIQLGVNNTSHQFIVKSFILTEKMKVIFTQEELKNTFLRSLALFTLFSELNLSFFPKMITYNIELLFIVMEKIEGISLDKMLLSENTNNIENELLKYVEILAELHGKTSGKEVLSRYKVLLKNFGYPEELREINWTRGSKKSVNELQKKLQKNGIFLQNSFFTALKYLFLSVQDSDYLSIIHTDLCPDNIIISNNKLFIIDLDTVDYYYFFIDVTFFEIFFPTCWCVGLIPKKIQENMRKRYFKTINKYIAVSEESYKINAFISAVLMETTSLVSYFTEYNGKKSIDYNKWGIDTIYNRIQTRFNLIKELGSKIDGYDEIKKGFEILKTKIQQKYGKAEGLKPYPVFSGH